MIRVNGLDTHYLEAGSGPKVVLLHSGEFGGCAELSWEHTIQPLAEHFHVFAPDWLGYGQSAKVFSFDDMWGFRVTHITDFLRAVGIEKAHFVGNSMGGTMLLTVAAAKEPEWPLDRIVAVAGGGAIPENAARDILNGYDGSREHMRKIVDTMFVTDRVRGDEIYLDRRHRLSLDKGAWECTAAVRFKAPWRTSSGMPVPPDYSGVGVPVLLVTGAKDPLRELDFGPRLQAQIPGSRLHVVEHAGHCPQIDAPAEFNRVVIAFLKSASP